MTKVAGDPPNIAKLKGVDLPPVIAAKVCIDPSGAVMSADIVSKIDHRAASDLADQLRGWRYSPYKKDGVAMSACFSVAFRVR